jgi:predicted metal-dependent hydrolase
MIGWEILLGAALEAGLGVLAEVGFGDEIGDLKERLTKRTEKARQAAMDRAIEQAAAAASEERLRALLAWYRQQLKGAIPALIAKWEAIIGVHVADWGVKRMKTKWGSCTIEARRIWLNLELVKKPPRCLEYIIVHEIVHLLERHHNERFVAYMDEFMPQWRLLRDELNQAPLAHETWDY